MDIKILGTGCPKCNKLEKNVRKAVEEIGLDAEITKISDLEEIMSFGVMMTPGLVVDGELKSSGKLLKPKDITKLLKDKL